MKTSHFAILGLSFLYCANVVAAIPYVASLSMGPVWGNGNNAQTLNLGPEVDKTFTVNRATSTMLDAELFAGIQYQLPQCLQLQAGLAIAVVDNAKLSGDIWDDATPIFDNYTYQYKLRHSHLAVKGKLLLDGGYPVMPWVSISAGVGFNTAYHFQNSPTIFEAVEMSNFASNTTTAFTYTLGVGVQRQLNPHWQVGIGYEFADWGHSQLSPADGQPNSNVLSLSHYYTNGFLLNATFVA